MYVESVEITNKVDCCPRDIGMINVTVSTSPAGLDPTCSESMEYGGNTQDYKFICSPPARGSFVTMTLIGDNVTLVLCHVLVRTIGKLHAVPAFLITFCASPSMTSLKRENLLSNPADVDIFYNLH